MTTYVESSTSNVPAFLSKLWMLVEEETTDELICWDPVSVISPAMPAEIMFFLQKWPVYLITVQYFGVCILTINH